MGLKLPDSYQRLTMLEMVSLAVKVELTMLMLSEFPVGRRRRMSLKVPKHEIFDSVFFASKEPIWSPDT